MNTETLFVLVAVAGAAALLLMPKKASAAPAVTARFGGAAGTQWDDAKTAAYRAQLAAELGNSLI